MHGKRNTPQAFVTTSSRTDECGSAKNEPRSGLKQHYEVKDVGMFDECYSEFR